MTTTQLILLTSVSSELKEKIVKDGPIMLSDGPAVVLSLPPKITAAIGRVRLRKTVVESIERHSIAIACKYESGVVADRRSGTISKQWHLRFRW
jgi:hypothetical protein